MLNNDKFHLNVPSKSDYISIVRLTTSGICSNLSFNIDEIEDIKVCVSEACNNVIVQKDIQQIYLDYEIDEKGLIIEVKDVLEKLNNDKQDGFDGELGLLIISSLMDKVEFTDRGIKMVKYIE